MPVIEQLEYNPKMIRIIQGQPKRILYVRFIEGSSNTLLMIILGQHDRLIPDLLLSKLLRKHNSLHYFRHAMAAAVHIHDVRVQTIGKSIHENLFSI